MKQIICRSDDFDFRLDTKDYIEVHQLFLDRGLVETANMQFAQFDRLGNIRPDLVEYINSHKDSYDIQLHGWQHDKYSEMEFTHIVRDLAAGIQMCEYYFATTPTIWYPPWNCYSENMQKAADLFGMTIDTESYDISRFIRDNEAGNFSGHSFYFHAWQKPERDQLPKALDIVKSLLTNVR